MQRYGLIGKTLKHSFSQQYFKRHHPEVAYTLFELENLRDLRTWIIQEKLSGFNVTIPYKIVIIPLLDRLTPEAEAIGAVNCVKVIRNSKYGNDIELVGHNTDFQAFHETFTAFINKEQHPNLNDMTVWILGNGGAAKAVSSALQKLSIHYNVLSHSEIDNLNNTISPKNIPSIVINATPAGMHPHTNESPLPLLCDTNKFTFPEHWFCYDLIYNPEETKLLHDASIMGASTHNGLQMLYRQAELSLDFWTTKK